MGLFPWGIWEIKKQSILKNVAIWRSSFMLFPLPSFCFVCSVFPHKKKSLNLGGGEDGFSTVTPQSCSFVTTWIYRPHTPIAVFLSAGSGAIISSHPPSSALLAASEKQRDGDIMLSGATNEFSGVDHRPLSGPYGHQKHADEGERCRCGKAKASPAACTLCATLAWINAGKFTFRAQRWFKRCYNRAYCLPHEYFSKTTALENIERI